MTVTQERVSTAQDGETMPEVTIGLIDDEYRRHQFVAKFGERAVEALRIFADQRIEAGMGPQHPTILHHAKPDGKTDYRSRELGDL